MDNQNATSPQQPVVQAPPTQNLQPPQQPSSPTTKKRGVFLTVMLVLTAFGILQMFYQLINPETLPQVPGVASPANANPMLQILMFVGLIYGAVTIVGLWMWKKWAVYLYAGSAVISIISTALIQKMVYSVEVRQQIGLLAYMLPLVGAGLMYWAIARKWQYFK